jgi:hypothetical protein
MVLGTLTKALGPSVQYYLLVVFTVILWIVDINRFLKGHRMVFLNTSADPLLFFTDVFHISEGSGGAMDGLAMSICCEVEERCINPSSCFQTSEVSCFQLCNPILPFEDFIGH